MLVTVRYYAMLKEITGISKESFDLPDGCDGSHLLSCITDRHIGVSEYVPFLRLATDEEYIMSSTILKEGVVISVIPPVSGG